jgi:predicted transposase/invertase (TIGR01784 family)
MGQQTPHDRFIREVLSNKTNAVDFFKGVLPDDIVQHLDLQSLAQDKTKYTDEQLDEYFSDIVYTCRYTGDYHGGSCVGKKSNNGYSAASMKLALLFEHKSFIPAFPHTQLLRYILNIWNQHIKQRKPLPVVLPILFYHGKRKWRKQSLHEYLSGRRDRFADSPELNRFIPEFDYVLIDLSDFSDEEIKTEIFTREAVKIALLVQKHIFSPERLRKYLKDFFKLGILYFRQEEGLRFLENVCRYIYTATEIEAETIIKTVDVLPQRAEEVVMTTAEKLRKEGREEGKEEGREEGHKEGWEKGQKEAKLEDARKMLLRGYPIKDICDITGLPLDEVRKLK